MSSRTAVASADFTRNIGYWQAEALKNPISITHHGRERLVLAAPDQFSAEHPDVHAAVNALTEERALRAALLESLSEAFIEFSPELRATRVNAVAEALIGKSREQIDERTARDLFADPMAAVLSDRLQRVLRTRRTEMFEADSASGAHLAVRVFPLLGRVGVLLYDATDLTLLQREREESAALAEAVSAHAAIAAIKLDVRGRIARVSDAFSLRTGFNGGEIVGYRFLDLVSAGRRRDVGAALERVIANKTSEQAQLTVVARSGEEIGGALTLSPVLAGPAARGALGVWAIDP